MAFDVFLNFTAGMKHFFDSSTFAFNFDDFFLASNFSTFTTLTEKIKSHRYSGVLMWQFFNTSFSHPRFEFLVGSEAYFFKGKVRCRNENFSESEILKRHLRVLHSNATGISHNLISSKCPPASYYNYVLVI